MGIFKSGDSFQKKSHFVSSFEIVDLINNEFEQHGRFVSSASAKLLLT